ncbi:MAG: response regulator [Chloroflexota bacterium]
MVAKQILVVDDDANVQKVVSIMLEGADYYVETANDGLEALDKLESFNPDLIITDYNMPHMTGYELCLAVKQDIRFQLTPFIILTGLDDLPTKVKSLQNGAVDYITKPFSHEELLARVASQLNHTDRLTSAFQKQIEETRTNLLSNVSHELRTPLRLIMGHISLLLEDVQSIPNMHQQFLSTASQACYRLNQVVENLMFLAEAQSGQLVFYPTPLTVEHLIQKATQTITSQHDVRIDLDLPRKPLPSMLADSNKLEVVFQHLLGNSVKFAYPGRPVEISVRAREADHKFSTYHEAQPAIRIDIGDNGVGLDETQLPHIFELFHQADGSVTRTHGGMGVGLKIVHIIMNLHHGQVEVTSTSGQGSTFSLILPIFTTMDAYADEIQKTLDIAEKSQALLSDL